MLKMLVMMVNERRSRRFIKGGVGAVSRDMLDVMGYGVYAGRKKISTI
jgi:hypothetical protein